MDVKLRSPFFEIPSLDLFEPVYHEVEILEQLKAEELGFA